MKSFILILFFFPSFMFSQENKDNEIQSYIDSVIICLNAKDDSAYVKMASLEVFLMITKEKLKTDSAGRVKYMIDMIEAKPEMFDLLFTDSFNKLLLNIEKKVDSSDWHIKFLEYKIGHEEDDGIFLHYTVKTLVLINGQKKNITLYLTKYNGDYCIIEPIGEYLSD